LRDAKIKALDKWTVEIKIAPEYFEPGISRFQDFASIVPHEVVEKYSSMQDWRTSVGSGAFILTDYVAGSSATLVKNTKYWQTNPIGPGKGDQLPYLDGVKYVIITDASAREAAFRTAKIDVFTSADWETGARLTKENSKLIFKKHTQDTTPNNTFMRTDKPPFNDIRVRRALFMATDFESIKNDLFGGEADVLTWPMTPVREYKDAFLSLDDAPDSVKDLYKYDPTKAKALLTEAGYPNGFKVTVTARNLAERVDYYSVLKNMWAKVGVDITMELKELAVWESITGARNYDGMIHSHTAPCGGIYRMINYRGPGRTNGSYINDQTVEEYYPKIQAAYITNPPEADRLHKELMKYVLDQAWVIPTPLPPLYHIWWPWVHNFNGTLSPGYDNTNKFTYFTWINRDLKEQMTGRR
jgi:peptide/nickel transport system substrate-binding protein